MRTEADTCRTLITPKLQGVNADLVQQFPDYVCRVTADEGAIGKGHMQRFQDVETRTPVILTTSQLLTTSLDYTGNGKQLRVVKLTDYTAEKVRTLCASPDELRARWADAGQRADRVKQQRAAFFNYYAPEAREILSDLTGNHDSRQRTAHAGASISWQRWERQYASDGELQFTLPDVLKVPPISHRGNVAEIAKRFGGLDQLGNAVNQLQSLIYAA